MIRTLLPLILMLLAVPLHGQELSVHAGEIASGKISIPAAPVSLTLRGTLDASDLDRLATVIRDAGTIDLSGIEILPYTGKSVGANITSSPAGSLPPYSLAGLHASRLILPSGVTAVGDGALLGSTVKEITLPAKVNAMGEAVFSGCTSLIEVDLTPLSAGTTAVSAVPARTFDGCSSLASVTLPAGISSIGARAFFGCSSLASLPSPASLTAIGPEAFAMSGLESVTLDSCKGLITIGNRAFARCIHLTSASLPAPAHDLGEGVFSGCEALLSVSLPASATTVPALTLNGAHNITSLTLPAGTDSIASLALAGMSGVTALTFPSTLRHIGDYAMEGWESLSTLDGTAMEAVPATGAEVWGGIDPSKVSLTVAGELEDLFASTPQWQDFNITRSWIPGILPDGETDTSIKAMFSDKELRVSSTAGAISRVTLYGIDGRMLMSIAPRQPLTEISADTSTLQGPFFIVRVTAGDSSSATFKLLRN